MINLLQLLENLDAFSDSEDFAVKASPSIKTLNYKFSLDTLLTEKIEKVRGLGEPLVTFIP